MSASQEQLSQQLQADSGQAGPQMPAKQQLVSKVSQGTPPAVRSGVGNAAQLHASRCREPRLTAVQWQRPTSDAPLDAAPAAAGQQQQQQRIADQHRQQLQVAPPSTATPAGAPLCQPADQQAQQRGQLSSQVETLQPATSTAAAAASDRCVGPEAGRVQQQGRHGQHDNPHLADDTSADAAPVKQEQPGDVPAASSMQAASTAQTVLAAEHLMQETSPQGQPGSCSDGLIAAAAAAAGGSATHEQQQQLDSMHSDRFTDSVQRDQPRHRREGQQPRRKLSAGTASLLAALLRNQQALAALKSQYRKAKGEEAPTDDPEGVGTAQGEQQDDPELLQLPVPGTKRHRSSCGSSGTGGHQTAAAAVQHHPATPEAAAAATAGALDSAGQEQPGSASIQHMTPAPAAEPAATSLMPNTQAKSPGASPSAAAALASTPSPGSRSRKPTSSPPPQTPTETATATAAAVAAAINAILPQAGSGTSAMAAVSAAASAAAASIAQAAASGGQEVAPECLQQLQSSLEAFLGAQVQQQLVQSPPGVLGEQLSEAGQQPGPSGSVAVPSRPTSVQGKQVTRKRPAAADNTECSAAGVLSAQPRVSGGSPAAVQHGGQASCVAAAKNSGTPGASDHAARPAVPTAAPQRGGLLSPAPSHSSSGRGVRVQGSTPKATSTSPAAVAAAVAAASGTAGSPGPLPPVDVQQLSEGHKRQLLLRMRAQMQKLGVEIKGHPLLCQLQEAALAPSCTPEPSDSNGSAAAAPLAHEQQSTSGLQRHQTAGDAAAAQPRTGSDEPTAVLDSKAQGSPQPGSGTGSKVCVTPDRPGSWSVAAVPGKDAAGTADAVELSSPAETAAAAAAAALQAMHRMPAQCAAASASRSCMNRSPDLAVPPQQQQQQLTQTRKRTMTALFQEALQPRSLHAAAESRGPALPSSRHPQATGGLAGPTAATAGATDSTPYAAERYVKPEPRHSPDPGGSATWQARHYQQLQWEQQQQLERECSLQPPIKRHRSSTPALSASTSAGGSEGAAPSEGDPAALVGATNKIFATKRLAEAAAHYRWVSQVKHPRWVKPRMDGLRPSHSGGGSQGASSGDSQGPQGSFHRQQRPASQPYPLEATDAAAAAAGVKQGLDPVAAAAVAALAQGLVAGSQGMAGHATAGFLESPHYPGGTCYQQQPQQPALATSYKRRDGMGTAPGATAAGLAHAGPSVRPSVQQQCVPVPCSTRKQQDYAAMAAAAALAAARYHSGPNPMQPPMSLQQKQQLGLPLQLLQNQGAGASQRGQAVGAAEQQQHAAPEDLLSMLAAAATSMPLLQQMDRTDKGASERANQHVGRPARPEVKPSQHAAAAATYGRAPSAGQVAGAGPPDRINRAPGAPRAFEHAADMAAYIAGLPAEFDPALVEVVRLLAAENVLPRIPPAAVANSNRAPAPSGPPPQGPQAPSLVATSRAVPGSPAPVSAGYPAAVDVRPMQIRPTSSRTAGGPAGAGAGQLGGVNYAAALAAAAAAAFAEMARAQQRK